MALMRSQHTEHLKLTYLVACKERLGDRIQFLEHKIADLSRLVRQCNIPLAHRQVWLNQLHTIRAMITNLVHTRATVDGLMDSVVNMGILRHTERVLAATIAVSAVEELMASVVSSLDSVNEVSALLSEDISGTESIPIDIPREPLPDVPTSEPVRHARRTPVAIG
jgi:hypothetical protein